MRSPETERAAFEAWARGNGFHMETGPLGYYDSRTHCAWVAWQERATAAPEATHSAASLSDDLIDTVSKAMRRSYTLGQTYWQQADSDSYLQNRKADDTTAKFQVLINETRALLEACARKEKS